MVSERGWVSEVRLRSFGPHNRWIAGRNGTQPNTNPESQNSSPGYFNLYNKPGTKLKTASLTAFASAFPFEFSRDT